MREILFRGIDAVTGKWVQGDLLHISSGCIIYHGSQTESEIKENTGAAIELLINEISVVKPKTVGQFTGLTDKNGVKIFEGDILNISEFWNKAMIDFSYEERCLFELNDLKGELHKKYITDVIYEQGCFVIKTGKEDYDCYASALEGNQKHSQPIFDCEIIGNIHNNPELLNKPF